MPTRSGIRTSTTHAPRANFVAATTIATPAVITAPVPLTAMRQVHPALRRRQKRTAMPAWERVKAMNTPTV